MINSCSGRSSNFSHINLILSLSAILLLFKILLTAYIKKDLSRFANLDHSLVSLHTTFREGKIGSVEIMDQAS